MSVASAWPAAAQNLKLEFHDGRVTVDAQPCRCAPSSPNGARLGGTKIVGAERMSGAPLTLKLINVPEAQALDIILRNVAGYMAAPRSAGVTGASSYDRILVMATTSAPPPPPRRMRGRRSSRTPRSTARSVSFRPAASEAAGATANPMKRPSRTRIRRARRSSRSRSRALNQPGQFQNAPPNAGQAGAITVNPPNSGAGNVTISPTSPSAPVGVSQPGMMVQSACAQPAPADRPR